MNQRMLVPAVAIFLALAAGLGLWLVLRDTPSPIGTKDDRPADPDGPPPRKRDNPAVAARDFDPAVSQPDPVQAQRPEPFRTPEKLHRVEVSGRVVDEAGLAVPDARVRFVGEGALGDYTGTAHTDAGGRYTLAAWNTRGRAVGSGQRSGRVLADDPLGRQGITALTNLAAEDAVDMPDVVLAASAEIRGRVQDPSGGPAAGVTVSVRSMTTHESIPEGQRSVRVQHVYLSRAATTDHRGEFRFVGLRPGRYSLGAESSYFGHAPQRQEVEAPASRPVWADVNLTATAWVRGVVRDSDGRPVPGAVVRVTGADGRPPAVRAPDLSNARDEAGGVLGTSRKDDLRLRLNAGNMALTDDQGRFGFFGLAAGPWTVTTRVGESEAVVEGQEPGGPDVVLVVQADSVLAGVVRDAETGRPVEQFDLRLLRGSQDKVTPYDRVSAERAFPLRPGGEWRVLNATGSVLLRASAPGYAPATLKLDDLAAGQRRDNLEIRLLPLCSLTLNLSFEGARLEFEPVMLMFERGLVYESTTDAAGRARPGQVMPARYEVRAVLRDGTRLAATVDVPARAAATLEVALIRSTEK